MPLPAAAGAKSTVTAEAETARQTLMVAKKAKDAAGPWRSSSALVVRYFMPAMFSTVRLMSSAVPAMATPRKRQASQPARP